MALGAALEKVVYEGAHAASVGRGLASWGPDWRFGESIIDVASHAKSTGGKVGLRGRMMGRWNGLSRNQKLMVGGGAALGGAAMMRSSGTRGLRGRSSGGRMY